MNVPNALKQRYDEGRLVPFFGAGISMSVRWDGGARRGMSWSELVDQAARILGFDEPDLLRVRGTDLQILEYYAARNNGNFDRLNRWFSERMNPADEDLKASRLLNAIVNLKKCPIMYTTNFDDFIERALSLSGREVHALSVEADIAKKLVSRPSTNSVDVVKFHGDLNNSQRMVLSEEDYDKRMRFVDLEDQRLRADVLGKAVLFLGYSFRDYNVSYLFRELQNHYGPLPEAYTGQRAYIALFDPSDFERQLFKRRSIEVIDLESYPDRGQAAAALLEELVR